jgi:RHS repeat-associated protein
VEDTNGTPKEGLPVYVFDGSSYTGYNDISDVNGVVVFDLPDGSYRFRSDLNGTQFWSGTSNHCDVPGCSEATVVVTIPVTVTVEDTDGLPKEGLPVYAFSGGTYTGFNGTTDVNGEIQLTLPHGDYRFRSDLNGTQFWSGETDHCTIPGCLDAAVVVTFPVTVTVMDTELVPQEGLPVYAFAGATYTGYNGMTDVNGEVIFTLPQGDYRFRSDLNETQFWSESQNHCTIPGCDLVTITVTISLTVTVQSQTGSPYPDLLVYAFDGTTYTGFNGVSDADGQMVFTLPEGSYRFRADYDGVQFWSGEVNHCTIPGCLEALVEIPGGVGEVNVTIDYAYDPLYRLTAADYSTGEYFWYTYDAVGNRLTQVTHEGSKAHTYDIANRLIEVDGVPFIWDDNGNLIQDDVRIYNYDSTNRLRFVLMDGDTYTYTYSGLGDRLRQTVNGLSTDYTLDINRGLTQVLGDGTNTYLYGIRRIGEKKPIGWAYHQVDALGSIRQLIDLGNAVTLTQSYDPYGGVLSSTGTGETTYGFTGEQRDLSQLIYLRLRYYSPEYGRFLTSDPWAGTIYQPHSLVPFNYVSGNPINQTDPSGMIAEGKEAIEADDIREQLLKNYGVSIRRDWGYQTIYAGAYNITSINCVWREGAWRNLAELKLTQMAIDRFSSKLGGHQEFKSAMEHRQVSIVRVSGPTVDIPFIEDDPPAMAPPLIGWAVGHVLLSDGVFRGDDLYSKYTIAHELAHVWDERQDRTLSFGMMEALDTWICDNAGNCGWYPYTAHIDEKTLEIMYPEPPPGSVVGCSGPPTVDCPEPYAYSTSYFTLGPGWEDWAESFASYAYTNYWPSRVTGDYIGLIPGGVRYEYIIETINSIP